jgi:hypothetical protein
LAVLFGISGVLILFISLALSMASIILTIIPANWNFVITVGPLS